MAVLLGLIVATAFGSADFFGGRASARASTVTVLFLGQIVAVVVAAFAALAVGARITGHDLGLGAAAGIANVAGLGFLYRGLARARAGIVAPLTAVVGALVPVGWALARGERPSATVLVGVVCAITAGGLIAQARAVDDDRSRSTGVGHACIAGVCFGTSIVLFAETADTSGFYPLLAARATALVVLAIVVAALVTGGRAQIPSGGTRQLALAVGAVDVSAALLLLVAIRHGLLVVVAPVVALAPAFTVVWAWILMHERFTRVQVVGLVLALTGLVLVAAG